MVRKLSTQPRVEPDELKVRLARLLGVRQPSEVDLDHIPEDEIVDHGLPAEEDEGPPLPGLSTAERLAYLTLLKKVDPALRGEASRQLREAKQQAGLDTQSEATETRSVDLMSTTTQGKEPTLYSMTKIRDYLRRKTKQMAVAHEEEKTAPAVKPKPKKNKTKPAKEPKKSKEVLRLEGEFKDKLNSLMDVTAKMAQKQSTGHRSKSMAEVHQGAVQRAIKELEEKAKLDMKYIMEENRLRQHFNDKEFRNQRAMTEIN